MGHMESEQMPKMNQYIDSLFTNLSFCVSKDLAHCNFQYQFLATVADIVLRITASCFLREDPKAPTNSGNHVGFSINYKPFL